MKLEEAKIYIKKTTTKEKMCEKKSVRESDGRSQTENEMTIKHFIHFFQQTK